MHRTERSRTGGKALALGFPVSVLAWICCVAVVHGIRVPGETLEGNINHGNKPRATVVFAMGCFWRAEAVFGCLPGVLRTRVGYCGGTKLNPNYRNIGDHAECLEVEYDPSAIKYEQLLDLFWSSHDPSQIFGQGPDVGEQYRSVILTQSEEETSLAYLSKKREQVKLGDMAKVATEVQSISDFYQAEAEHQKFELKRKTALLQLFGDWSQDELVTSTTATKLNSYAAGFCQKSVQKLIDSKVRPLLKSRPQLLQIFGE